MSKLISLLKATMSGGIQLFNYRGKTERSRRILPVVLAILIGLLILFSANATMVDLRESGGESAVLVLYTLVTSIIIVTEGAYKAGDLLFKPRDNDMLLAMPIQKSTIVLARIIKFYAFEMVYCLIFLLPAMIAYAMNIAVEPSYYLVAVTMLVMIPAIPIAISCVIGLIISAIATRFKHKSLLQVILSFVALFACVGMMLAINMTPDFDGHYMVAISDKITELYYPARVFLSLTANFDIWQYLAFVAVNLLVIVVTIALISRFYFQIVTRMSTIRRNESTIVNYNLKKHSQVGAMVRKELNKYFNTPVLLMNTALGLVLFIVAVGALCLKYDDLAASLASSIENFPLTLEEMRAFLPSVAFAMVAFASLMTFITTTMISLEGRVFSLLKTMPISGRKVIMSKVLTAMLLIVPVTALGSLVMAIRFQFGILEVILVLIAVVAIPLVTELIGILIDLKYARFDAESDAVVVKQSAGVMVATFLGLGMTLFTISLTFATVFLAGQTVGLLIMDAVFIVVSLFLCFAVATRGEEKYTKLTA